jgi:hypothetical protein
MSDLLDYVSWRGDIPFSVSSFNEADALILCQLSYLDFHGLIGTGFVSADRVAFARAASAFKTSQDYKSRSDLGIFINAKTLPLLEAAGNSLRFGDMKICGYRNIVDDVREEQFAAVTFLLSDRTVFIAFRGTDSSLTGWKEDFNMAFLDRIPAQQDAVEYLTEVLRSLHGRIRVGGHSKGGNLSVYSSVFLPEKYEKRLIEVYNFDGPGQGNSVPEKTGYRLLLPKLHSFFPQFSIVGMLFEHPEKYTVVESEESGIMQHDPFSWHVTSDGFVTVKELEEGSLFFDRTVNGWFFSLSRQQREQFVETVFSLIQATEARTSSELAKNWLKNSKAALKALAVQSGEMRENAFRVLQLLLKHGAMNLPEMKNNIKIK